MPSQPIFAFAGIHRLGEDWPCFAILATDPNRLVGGYQPHAMPVILHPDQHAIWLSGDCRDAVALAVPFPGQLMTVSDAPPM